MSAPLLRPVVAAVAGLVLVLSAGCGSSGAPEPAATTTAPAPRVEVKGVGPLHGEPPPFAADSIWNAPVARRRVDADSAAMVAALLAEIRLEQRSGRGPAVNTSSYGVPVVVVPRNTPTTAVRLVDHAPDAALQEAWSRVPLPRDARASAGSDANLVVWQPSRDRLWEFWRLRRDGQGGWQASWGGAMRNVSRNAGYYTRAAWPGAKSWWGASASSLAILGGIIRASELRSGIIDHALALAIPSPRAGTWAAPAQRSDGTSTSPVALPEGAHLRLDPSLDLDALDLPRDTRVVAEAAQRYGLIVRDRAANVALVAEVPLTTPTLDGFPWERLQVLDMKLRTPADLDPAG